MLLNFGIKNYKSFGKQTDFSFYASDDTELDQQLMPTGKSFNGLKLSLFYGRNGSGKTNMVDAIDFATKMIRGGTVFDVSEKTFEYNKRPVSFEFIFQVDELGDVYGYSFSVQGSRLMKESLVRFLDGYRKDGETYKIEKIYEYYADKGLRLYHDYKYVVYNIGQTNKTLVKNGLLVLPYLSHFHSIFKKLDDYLTESIIVRRADDLHGIGSVFHVDGDYLAFLNDQLHRYISRDLSLYRSNSLKIYSRWKTVHGLELEMLFNESDGVRSLLNFLPCLYKEKVEGKTIIYDDFGKNLYQSLLFDLFLDCFSVPAQYIFTTHNVALMDRDVRRDAIHFIVKKVKSGYSMVVDLCEFKLGEVDNYSKLYLDGRFDVALFR